MRRLASLVGFKIGRRSERSKHKVEFNTAGQLVQCTPQTRYHIVVPSESRPWRKKENYLTYQTQHSRKHTFWVTLMSPVRVSTVSAACIVTDLKKWTAALSVFSEGGI